MEKEWCWDGRQNGWGDSLGLAVLGVSYGLAHLAAAGASQPPAGSNGSAAGCNAPGVSVKKQNAGYGRRAAHSIGWQQSVREVGTADRLPIYSHIGLAPADFPLPAVAAAFGSSTKEERGVTSCQHQRVRPVQPATPFAQLTMAALGNGVELVSRCSSLSNVPPSLAGPTFGLERLR